MENQIHQEFQRLKTELDKLSSYSRSLERAEENVQETGELIQKVGEKYENLVDLIWREFNEELDSLKDLKSQIQSESTRIEQALFRFQQEGFAAQSTGKDAEVSAELLSSFNERLKALESRMQKQFDTLGTHLNRFAQLHQNIESNLSRKIDYQLGQLTNRITQLDVQIQNKLKQSLQESLSDIKFPTDLKTSNPINNGLGKHLKDQLDSIHQKMNHADVQLKELIQGSLEESLSSWMQENQSRLNVADSPISIPDTQLAEQIKEVSKKLEESDISIRNIIRGLNVSLEEALKQNQQHITTSMSSQIKGDLLDRFQQVDQKISQTNTSVQQLLENFQDNIQAVISDSEAKSQLFQDVAKSLKKENNEESLETIKKVTRNQFQKLLDHENDMKKQKQLLGIVTVISLLNLILIVIMIITFSQMAG